MSISTRSKLVSKIPPIVILFAMACTTGLAFDPGRPPPEWTLANTLKYVGTARMVRVHFTDASLPEALEFLMVNGSRAYNPELETDDLLGAWSGTLSLDESDVLIADIFAKIAQKIGADIVVSPGVVKFQARKSSAEKKAP